MVFLEVLGIWFVLGLFVVSCYVFFGVLDGES